jgi:mono/diheme cytochrome c family protein
MKRKVAGILAGILLLMGLAACGNSSNNSNQSSSSKTMDPQKIVNQTCDTCHGDNLKGAYGPNISHIGKELDKDQIANIINHGKGQMPPGLINSKQAEVVAAYLAKKK